MMRVGFVMTRDPDPRRTTDEFRSSDLDPPMLFTSLRFVGFLGCFAGGAFGLAWLGTWLALHALHILGHTALIRVYLFGEGFLIAGVFDALWRYVLAWKAYERYKRADRAIDETTRRLSRLAQLNDGRILIQIAAGLAWVLYSG
jgi:hypothetical protein